jgi:hypothetical protein
MADHTMATLLAPVATLMTASGPGRSLFWLYGLSHVPISDDPELVTGPGATCW